MGRFLGTLRGHSSEIRPMKNHFIKHRLLFEATAGRKGKTTEEILRAGLNIYPKKEVTVETLFEEAYAANYMAVSAITEDGTEVQITNEGILALTAYLTDGFSPTYKGYEQAILDALHSMKVTPITKYQIMKFFHSGRCANSVIQLLTENDRRHGANYHYDMIREFNGIQSLNEDDYIFHFFPKLYLEQDLIGAKVELKIDGIATPPLSLSTPYPNKRYVVAGVKKGRLNNGYGCYPLIGPASAYPERAGFVLNWTINEELTIRHMLDLEFDFSNPVGQFFSTEQHYSRPLPYKSRSLVTTTKKEMLEQRNAEFYISQNFTCFEIRERATLVNFPIHLHAGQGGNHFSRWFHENRTIRRV